jgi:hypothetical protein
VGFCARDCGRLDDLSWAFIVCDLGLLVFHIGGFMTKQFFTEADCDMWQNTTENKFSYQVKGISLARANELIEERGVVVYAHSEIEQRKLDCYDWKPYANFLGAQRKALLINIQPIVKDSAESLLKELVAQVENYTSISENMRKLVDRARALLGKG